MDFFPLNLRMMGNKLVEKITIWINFLKKYKSVKKIEKWWIPRIKYRRYKQKQYLDKFIIPDLLNVVIQYL